MTALAINYVVNPFANFASKLYAFFEVVGYARAAAHLSSLGYHKEAQRCMMFADEIKNRQAEVNPNLKDWV